MRQKTTSLALFAAAFLASYSLLYLTGDRFTYSRGFDAPVNRAAFDGSTFAPVEFLTVSRSFDAEMERVDAAMTSVKTVSAMPRRAEPHVAENDPPEPARLASLDPPTLGNLLTFSATPPAPPVAHNEISSASTEVSQTLARVASTEMPASQPTQIQRLVRELDPNVDRISFNSPALAPMAFMRFCLRYPGDCNVSGMAFRASPVVLTEARRAELTRVNRAVNRAIRPQENLGGVMAEEWVINPTEGDCNDYAVSKRHELLALGWPSRALLLAEVIVPSGEHHLILIVRGREDDLVLDNLNWNIRSVSQIRYQWIRVQQANNPKFWSVAGVTHASRVALNARQGRGS